ncbi:uncharacterized protein E0L32_005787 [Thyridium curvatum]|uniref:Uncharacterized protein n=1 Tax=Thyridium curvatum TaxID=1093900 RepID=A0A507B1U0_9PEZI|nr:uncharacterized protein E0L32_005787 [Thyridium curvatum]TPX13843.1 hypothetical protein E0L32_005787 [Thyridium curvatum]
MDSQELTSRVNPDYYAKLIIDYARQSLGDSAFSGDIYEGLAAFLSREFDDRVPVDVIVHTLASGPDTSQRSEKIAAGVARPSWYKTANQLEHLRHVFISEDGNKKHQVPVQTHSTAIIFMQGHQPPECLTRLGAFFNIDPRFFNRHLEYFWHSRPLKLFPSPSLPSASFGIIRLRLVTLGEHKETGKGHTRSTVKTMRSMSELAMEEYLHDLTREYMLQAGNSIVRAFNVHSTKYFSIEQEVTVTVKSVPTGGWVLLVWTDVGQDLSKGPRGPWHRGTTHTVQVNSPFLPNIHHFTPWSAGATKTPISRIVSGSHQPPSPFAQSALCLATKYGTTLDATLAVVDSFYSTTELFQASINSICQLLNLIETIVDESTGYKLYKSPNQSIANLAYHMDILNRFENRLRENVVEIESIESNPWPSGIEGTRQSSQHGLKLKTKEVLLTDIRNLIFRVENLLQRCQSGVSTCMGSAAIAESERAIQQAQQMRLLTRLAFFYIPLSFTTSFFGMNVLLFGSGNLQLSTWFVVSIPLLVVSYLALIMAERGWLSTGVIQRYYQTLSTRRDGQQDGQKEKAGFGDGYPPQPDRPAAQH